MPTLRRTLADNPEHGADRPAPTLASERRISLQRLVYPDGALLIDAPRSERWKVVFPRIALTMNVIEKKVAFSRHAQRRMAIQHETNQCRPASERAVDCDRRVARVGGGTRFRLTDST